MLKILILAMVLLLPTQSIANDNKNANAIVASKLTSIDDLKDKRIGVVMGSAHVMRQRTIQMRQFYNLTRQLMFY
jgi:ABC-type amino acid transport substrate-binding protein